MLVSCLYFRTHTNVGLQEEVHEERSDDYKVDTTSESHTLSPSLATSSTVSKMKKPDSPDLCVKLTKFIASRDKSYSENTTKKKQLTLSFEDIAQTMAKFPEVELDHVINHIVKTQQRKSN